MDVGVANQNMAGNCSPSLSADTGSSTLEREPTGAQDARTGASSAVVTERVDRTAAATSCSVERQEQAKPAEQQSAENRRVQGDSWQEDRAVRIREANGPDWDSSRANEGGSNIARKRLSSKARKAGRCQPRVSVDRLVGVCRDNGGLQGQVGEGRRWEASVVEKVDSTGEGAHQMMRHQASERCGRSQAHGLGVRQASQPRRRSRLLARAQPPETKSAMAQRQVGARGRGLGQGIGIAGHNLKQLGEAAQNVAVTFGSLCSAAFFLTLTRFRERGCCPRQALADPVR